MVTLLHHPLKGEAPADTDMNIQNSTESPFGVIPHSIRGFMTHYNNVLVTGLAYDKCTACSSKVLDQFKLRNFDFLLDVFNKPLILEDITGLTQIKEETDNIEWESNEDDF